MTTPTARIDSVGKLSIGWYPAGTPTLAHVEVWTGERTFHAYSVSLVALRLWASAGMLCTVLEV